MKFPTKRQTILISGLTVVAGLTGITAFAATVTPALEQVEPKQLDHSTPASTVHITQVEPEPLASPEPSQEPVTIEATPAPQVPITPPVAPGEDPVVAQRKAWMAEAGITESYDVVNTVLAKSNWNVQFVGVNRMSLCAHILPPHLPQVGLRPVSQLTQCHEWVKKMHGTWQQARETLAERGRL